MLDMLTDRCGTMCLLMTLCHFYPSYLFLFQLSNAIDIACHWLHVHTLVLFHCTLYVAVVIILVLETIGNTNQIIV